MLEKIAQWIDDTNREFRAQRNTCLPFSEPFAGSFSPRFLQQCYFVVVDNIPIPDFPELRQDGLSDFLYGTFQCITYNNVYYVQRDYEDRLSMHFHELVHVAQWQALGVEAFIQRYLSEITEYGYSNAPLEQMAYGFERRYQRGLPPLNVPEQVRALLA